MITLCFDNVNDFVIEAHSSFIDCLPEKLSFHKSFYFYNYKRFFFSVTIFRQLIMLII